MNLTDKLDLKYEKNHTNVLKFKIQRILSLESYNSKFCQFKTI